MSDPGDTRPGGLGLVSVLTIVFVVLKLTGNVAWSWLWVLSPLWISAALALVVLFFVGLIAVIRASRGAKERNRDLTGRR